MKQDKAVTLWLDQLRDASYDMEDVLEEWITETRKLQLDEGGDDDEDDDNDNAFVTLLTKVCSFFPAASNCFGCFKQLSLRHHIAVKIREINGKLDDIARQKDSFKFVENVSNNVKKPERVRTTSLLDEGEVFGRVDEKSELLSKLLGESSEQRPHIISLVGFGGIGKTTLAQLAYNNDEVKRNFEKVIWVCVSNTFEEIRVAKAIIEGLGESTSSLSEFQSLMSHIHKSIEGKKFFLVLDDVWDGDFNKWDPFFLCLKNGHHESKILITTRDRSVALQLRSIDIIPVKELAEEECWLLFKQIAFLRRSFEDREKFVVGGGVDGGGTCRIESLKNLQLLREFGIEGLSNVSQLDEAERLGLHNMENLLRLRLEFGIVVDGEGEEGRRKNEKDKQLLEPLQPPLNVEKLGIFFYGGNIFPKWLTSLTNLRELKLVLCDNCEHLPPLGKLPLEKLELRDLESVKRVGNEFLGIEESSEDSPSSSSSSPSVIAFPKLKSLEIWAMEELEEWNYRITRKENISIMPRLSSLMIWNCNKLKALPDYLLRTTALQELIISYCPIMEELPILEDCSTTDIPRLSSLTIAYCPKLKVLPDYLLRTTTLLELTIHRCPLLENRYREGKGEDWHKISHIPHIKW